MRRFVQAREKETAATPGGRVFSCGRDEPRSGAAEGEKRDLRRDPDADGRADGAQPAIDVEARLKRRFVTRG